MRIPRRKVLVAAGLAVLLAVGIICAVLDHLGAALVCVLLLQSVVMLAIVDSRRPPPQVMAAIAAVSASVEETSASVAENSAALAIVSRDLVNVSSRVVSETAAVRHEVAISRRSIRESLTRGADLRLQNVEAMFQLFSRFEPRAMMPPSGGWALEANGLLRIVDLIARRPIRTIVELGSGTSTLWLSYALEKRATGGRIISLDHEPHFASITRAALATHGFADGPAEVRDAGLTDDVLDGHLSPWYDRQAIQDIQDIDLLLVDGPPKSSGDFARYPALPVLLSRLAPGAIIVVDDAARPEETAMVERWLEEVPGLRLLDEAGPGRQILLILES